MNTTDTKALCEYISSLWSKAELTPELWRLFATKLAAHPPMPLQRAKEVVSGVYWNGTRYRTPDLPEIERALALEARRVAAGVRQQAEVIAANRAVGHDDEPQRDHEAAREFVRSTPLSELHRLRDRCRSRDSTFVRMLVSDKGPEGIKPDVATGPIDWSDLESILSHLWVCMGLWMEHTGANDWSPIVERPAADRGSAHSHASAALP